MRYHSIPVTSFQQNCSLLWCDQSNKAALIDPGGEATRLLEAVGQAGVTLEGILLTHGHLDHVGAASEISALTGNAITGPHIGDEPLLNALQQQAEMFGLPSTEPFTPDRWLKDGEVVNVGSEPLQVIHAPGHSPGHVVFYHEPSQTAFVGDVLFRGSIGRSDLPGGDQHALIQSIQSRLFPLGDDVTIVPGHGPRSTLGEERRSNPYVGA
ncbi:MBL fold metallo-hydrolase [Candidatus Reidiella endopervernicosa]|uniref:MBL fold metallo-hydrolase n=1 Tax=Candidatus Reidiella endopervernicosa TaxID=2738883 RepID=A0A6N0I147_9GAMM|nr:MBL fold metallo-hydrolase [Candidatus Reidiella endopervernicosa]